MTKRQKRILLPLLLILAALTLTACRPSTALTRLMNVANAINLGNMSVETDEDSEEEVPDDEDPVEEQSDDGQIEELENTIGQFMEDLLADETTADQALQAVYSALAEDDEWGEQEVNTEDVELTDQETKITVTLPGGSESSEGQGTASGVTTSNGQESESAIIQPEEKEEEEEKQEDEEQEDEPETSENTSGGENGDTEDPDLVNDDDPESDYEELETAEGQVAATGQLAILVSMLGGGDRLCATSADYDENELVQKAFYSESEGDYEVLWDGDGSSPMDDDEFERLLAMKPGLCVYISGYQTFSPEQVEQLEAADITCKPVDGFTSAGDIEDTVNELATLLGDTSADGGTNAPEIAASYLDWCADIEEDLDNIETSSEIVFIEDWDENVQTVYSVKEYVAGTGEDAGMWEDSGRTILADTGAAIIRIGSSFRPLSDYLGYASVSDYSAAPSQTYGDSRTLTWTEKFSDSICSPNDGDLCYITPLGSTLYGYYGSSYYWWNQAGGLSGMATGINCITYILNDSNYENIHYEINMSFSAVEGLGSGSFTTVITKNEDAKQALEDSWSWDAGKKELPDDTAMTNAYTTSGIKSNDYSVYVNPTGLGDWVDGSAESILESIWVAWRVQGYYTKEQVVAYIKKFYQEFYDLTLTTAQVNEILAEPTS